MKPDQKPNDAFFTHQARHVRQCLKEAKLAFAIWAAGLIYCTLTIVWLGYIPPSARPDTPELVWGMPAWVFWGLWLPWFVQTGLTWWFAIFILKEDEPFVEFPDRPGAGEANSTS